MSQRLEYICGNNETTDIVVFLDGDYSDYPEELIKIINPIVSRDIDFVLGSRIKSLREVEMLPQQIFEIGLLRVL